MAPKKTDKAPEWSTPTLRQAWVVEGGLCSHPLVVEDEDVHSVTTGKSEVVYVKAKKQAKWMYKALKGDAGLKGALQKSSVCEQLVRKFKEAVGEGSEASGSQDKSTVVDLDDQAGGASTVVEPACHGKMDLLSAALDWEETQPAKKTQVCSPVETPS